MPVWIKHVCMAALLFAPLSSRTAKGQGRHPLAALLSWPAPPTSEIAAMPMNKPVREADLPGLILRLRQIRNDHLMNMQKAVAGAELEAVEFLTTGIHYLERARGKLAVHQHEVARQENANAYLRGVVQGEKQKEQNK